jgi:hypothetical protein
MKISYRLSTGVMLATFAAGIAADVLFPHQLPSQRQGVAGLSWGPCAMWEPVSGVAQLSVVLFFLGVVTLSVAGILNRPLPRWLPILCLANFAVYLRYSFWYWQYCASPRNRAIGTIWFGTVVLMCLHQFFQRRTG